MRIIERSVQAIALFTVATVAASPAAAAGLGLAKASTFVTVTGYVAPSAGCPGNSVEVTPFLTDRGVFTSLPAGMVLVVTGFSWVISGATADSLARVSLTAAEGSTGNILVTSMVVANSAGLALGSSALQPGVVFRPAAGLTHLCIAQNSASGELLNEGSLQGYLAVDR